MSKKYYLLSYISSQFLFSDITFYSLTIFPFSQLYFLFFIYPKITKFLSISLFSIYKNISSQFLFPNLTFSPPIPSNNTSTFLNYTQPFSLPLHNQVTPHVHILLSQTRFFIGASLLTLPLEHPPHPSSPQDARRRRRGWEGRGAERTGAVLLHALFHAHFSASICAAARGMGPLSGRGYPLRHVTGAYTRTVHWKRSCELGQVRVTGSKDKNRVIVVYSDRTIRCKV